MAKTNSGHFDRMISIATGEINFDAPAFCITPRLSLDLFNSSPQFSGFQRVVWNAGFSQYHLRSAIVGQREFAVRLMFFAQRLQEVGLSCGMPFDSGGWANWSEVQERQRHEVHRSIVSDLIQRNSLSSTSDALSLPWGHIYPVFDAREHHTEIRVDYIT
jgi:hypothetical protein